MREACVILAGGRGDRMGGQNKALLEFRGRSFLENIVLCCTQHGIKEIVVVVAQPFQSKTISEAQRLGLSWTINHNPEQGMSSSVASGFHYALSHFNAEFAWLWPVDTPGVTTEILATLAVYKKHGSVVVPSYEKKGGHPVLVSRALWNELSECMACSQGARSVFRKKRERKRMVSVQEPYVCIDCDTPIDYKRLQGG